jgi:hypothetical protein
MITETPPLLTVSGRYADDHDPELRRHVRAGGVVRVINASTAEVIEYRSRERPSCLEWMQDDMDGIRLLTSERNARSRQGQQSPVASPYAMRKRQEREAS